jgi:hypothetical protein
MIDRAGMFNDLNYVMPLYTQLPGKPDLIVASTRAD